MAHFTNRVELTNVSTWVHALPHFGQDKNLSPLPPVVVEPPLPPRLDPPPPGGLDAPLGPLMSPPLSVPVVPLLLLPFPDSDLILTPFVMSI